MPGDRLVRARWRLAEVIPTAFVSQWSNLSVLSNSVVFGMRAMRKYFGVCSRQSRHVSKLVSGSFSCKSAHGVRDLLFEGSFNVRRCRELLSGDRPNRTFDRV